MAKFILFILIPLALLPCALVFNAQGNWLNVVGCLYAVFLLVALRRHMKRVDNLLNKFEEIEKELLNPKKD